MYNNNSFGGTSFGNTSFGSSTFGAGFGSTPLSAFGSTPQAAAQPAGPVGTTIRFVPITGTDSISKTGSGGGTTAISTRHQNISAMKEYESKSTDELRLEDYLANRKQGQPQTSFNSTPFWNNNNPSPFQMGTGFNAPRPNAGGMSLFNNNTQTNSSPFGATSLSTPNKTTNIFGGVTATNTNSIFGANTSASNTSGFMSQPTQPQPFGQTSTATSIFGGNTTQAAQPTSLFGSNTAVTSTAQPFSFQSTNTQQTPSLFNTSLQSDANKSAFPIPSASNSTFSFGVSSTGNTLAANTSTTTASLFGATTTTTASNTGLFGSNIATANASPFQIGSSFNATRPNTGGISLFNNNTQTNSSPFGATSLSTPNKTTNIFGGVTATNTNSIFGANTSASNTSGFMSQPTQPQPFGQTSTATSIFGGNTTQAAQPTSLFGSNTAVTSTAQPFSFQSTNTQQTPSLFNTSLQSDANKSAFPIPSASNSTFSFGVSSTGNTLAANTSTTTAPLFGALTTTTASAPSLFGSNLTNNLNFGSQNNTGSLFNTNSLQSPQTNTFQQTNQTLNQQQSPQSPDLLLNRLKTLPYGETSLFLNDTATSSAGLGSLKFTTDPKTISQYKMNAKTNVKLSKPTSEDKPRGNSVLFDGLDDYNNDDLRCAIDVFVPKRNIKRLDLSSCSHLSEGDADRTQDSPAFGSLGSRPSRDALSEGNSATRHVRYADNTFPGERTDSDGSFISNLRLSPRESSSIRSSSLNQSDQSTPHTGTNKPRGCGVVHTRLDYTIKPSLDEMERNYDPESDTCYVDSLLIERPDYGSIFFESRLNVKGLNLDNIVHIRRKEVVVYPDDENKPPVGRGINRPAIISLHQVWPVDKSNNEVIKDVNRLKLMRYPEKIESATIEKGARFIEYRPETGTWMFAVKHFSKYGITDDDEEMVHSPLPPASQPEPRNQNNFIMNTKTSIKLNSSSNLDKSRNDSLHLNSFNDTSNYSMKNAIDEFFDDEYNTECKRSDLKRSLTVHGTKRRALQNLSPNVSSISLPLVSGPTVPQQQKIRRIQVNPDLHAARNKLIRDIASVCISGSPKVRFFNGSRKFCYAQADRILVNELKLIPTASDGLLEEDVREKFETFLDNNSHIVSSGANVALAPHIKTQDFISDASSHDLLFALYGNLLSKTPYAKQDERLNRVINWLASYNSNLPAPSGLYQLMIYHMSCDRYDLAAETALDNNHPRLAMLIATLNINKVLMIEQLTSWRLSHADQYIDYELLKIYIILSGQTDWKLSNDVTIHCLKGLHWTQQLCLLAMHVPQSFITEPEKYYGFHMLPLYMRRLDTNTNDVNYHILARHSPSNILSAAESLLEEWFLLESLKSFHVVNSESECIQSDLIHCNTAAQLGPIDLRWACFVALHITNSEVRNHILITCLEQNHDQFKQTRNDSSRPVTVESWLIERLKVPVELIENSKVLASKSG